MGIMGIVGVMGDGTFGRKWGRKIDGSKKAFRTFLLPVLMEFAWSAGRFRWILPIALPCLCYAAFSFYGDGCSGFSVFGCEHVFEGN